MDKKEFCINWCLNRANTSFSPDGELVAKEAVKAWEELVKAGVINEDKKK